MTNDISQQNLKEPVQVDWDTAFASSKYVAPPPAIGTDGKPIVYTGQLQSIEQAKPDEGYLNFILDFAIVGAGAAYDGAKVRVWASTRPFTKLNQATGEREPMKGNPNKLASILRSAGLQAKPQTNSDYEATLKSIKGRRVPFTIDWEARSKDTGETVKGFNAFPVDAASGGRKTILRAGDTVNQLDAKGNIIGTTTVKSEVLFANAKVKYFQDAAKVTR